MAVHTVGDLIGIYVKDAGELLLKNRTESGTYDIYIYIVRCNHRRLAYKEGNRGEWGLVKNNNFIICNSDCRFAFEADYRVCCFYKFGENMCQFSSSVYSCKYYSEDVYRGMKVDEND